MYIVYVVYILITWKNVFLCFENCYKKLCKSKRSDEWKKLKKLKTIYSNQRACRMTNNFDLQDDTKLPHEVEKYKWMCDKAYKQIFFSFSKNVFYPNQAFLRLDFSPFTLRGFYNTLQTRFLNFRSFLF